MAAPKGNKNALGNNGGRPALFVNKEDLQKKIDEYFNDGANERDFIVGSGSKQQVIKLKVFTLTGLAYYLGFESRQSLYDYEKLIEFSYTIKRARLRIEMNYEENLQYGNTTGAIFALKNMDWSDRQEIDQNNTGEITITRKIINSKE